MEIVYLAAGLVIGIAATWLVLKYKFQSSKGISIEEANELREEINSLKIEKSRYEERTRNIEAGYQESVENLKTERTKVVELNAALASLKSNYSNLQEKLIENKREVEKLQEKFAVEFKNIANELLEDKSKRFTEQNKTNIESILNPLNEKIKEFEKRVNEIYVSDSRERASLGQQIKLLHELNQQMAKEANNLTTALKGQTKTQGNWGEMILESILEKSGLTKGREYLVQESLTTEEGKRYQPDVIVNLPENKSIVIDSKVSLIAYEKYSSGETEEERIAALKEHITSIRNHIKNLSSKNYQNLYQLKSLDFVLMFLPIEPAFSLAVQNDISIFNDAFEKNIVIVSPSTLLATLRTIASIWRQEHQNAHAIEIARQSGALYDKFVGFAEDLVGIGKNIDSTKKSYVDAMKKLTEGSGNLVRRVEKIKTLGAKASKSIPQNLLDRSEDETDDDDGTLFGK